MNAEQKQGLAIVAGVLLIAAFVLLLPGRSPEQKLKTTTVKFGPVTWTRTTPVEEAK